MCGIVGIIGKDGVASHLLKPSSGLNTVVMTLPALPRSVVAE